MLFGILMLCGIIQGSLACWSSNDCSVFDCPPVSECPVSDCPISTCPVSDCAVSESVSDSPTVSVTYTGPDSPSVSTSPTVTVSVRSECACSNNTINATALPPPLLTTEQADTLFMLSQSFASLSCEEAKKKIYNITEPPIQLSDDQMKALRDYYPGNFRKPNPSVIKEPLDSEPVHCNSTDSNRGKRSPIVSVCSTRADYTTLHLALDKRGNMVYVPQLTRFDLEQQFEEYFCEQGACFPSLNCQCDHYLFYYTARAVVTYIKKKNQNVDLKFYEAEIQLRYCSAYL
ncbi:uncharacterized protein LOC117122857 [Anneissia japonica]|uniref:uncharacterized protein LOC117122857 n=1 Tax=Anneissia japonica TaxID=1529436 RepID=UPI001425953B|nr:uncharacterized protein LOC117122857 [Anneissia japonica]